METLLTRKNKNVGVGVYDSIAWAFEVHLKEPDNKKYKSAVMYGYNEDSPDRIDFYTVASPKVDSKIARVWFPIDRLPTESKVSYSVKVNKSKRGRRTGTAGIGGVR